MDFCERRGNIKNFCAEQPWHWPTKDDLDGQTVFIRIDCITRMPLPIKEQDPIYRMPGVPLDNGLQKLYAKAWKARDEIKTAGNNGNKCEKIKKNSPKRSDCTHAIAQLSDTASLQVNGKREWSAVSERPHPILFPNYWDTE